MTLTDKTVLARVTELFEKNAEWLGLDQLDLEEKEHLIQCGSAVVETYLGLNRYQHGSFVKAVAENNLRDAFNCADDINARGMKFHAMLLTRAYSLVFT
jgi:hypothetical protein